MKHIEIKQISRKGQVYKVKCQKSGEMTLLINCHGCTQNKGYDAVKNQIKCEVA